LTNNTTLLIANAILFARIDHAEQKLCVPLDSAFFQQKMYDEFKLLDFFAQIFFRRPRVKESTNTSLEENKRREQKQKKLNKNTRKSF